MSTTLEKKETLNDALRKQTLDAAKQHKASWIELGQYLQTVFKDKHFKEWGFLTFEAYCMRELGIKQTTASKLVKSYQFLEKEEPRMTQISKSEAATPRALPDFETVNLLRLAKENENIAPRDYAELREAVMEGGREPKEIRAQVKKLLSEREDKDPAEARQERRNAMFKRLITMIRSAEREFVSGKLLPGVVLKQMSDLAEKLEGQIE